MKFIEGSASGRRLAQGLAVILVCASTQSWSQNAAEESLSQDSSPEASRARGEITFDVPAGSLAAALARFGEQAGVQLVYESKAVQGKQTPGVRGRMPVDTALQRLIDGANLTFRYLRTGAITLEPARSGEARVLGPVRVEGATREAPTRGEGVAQLGGIRGEQDQEERGLRPVVAAVGAGAPAALEDIPRSVSVLTQTQIEAQDIQDIGEVIRRLPGLSMIEATGYAGYQSGSVYSRGFGISSIQIDGGAPTSFDLLYNGLQSLNAYERVELVRGPNGVFAGTGSPGGSLNLVRKRPGTEESLELTGTTAQYGRYQGVLDWSTPDILGTPIAFRASASYEDQKFKWDTDHLKRGSLYAIVDTPLGDRARLEVGATYETVNQKGFYQQSLRYFDGPQLNTPFYFNYTPSWSYVDTRSAGAFTRFYVPLLGSWNFEVGIDYSKYEKRGLETQPTVLYLLSNADRPLETCTPSGGCTPRFSSLRATEYALEGEKAGTDFRVTGKFSTWGIDHFVTVGGDYSENISIDTNAPRTNPEWARINTLEDLARVPSYAPPTGVPFSLSDTSFKDSSGSFGLIVADSLSWRDRITLNLSARLQDQESNEAYVIRRPSDGVPYNISLNEVEDGTLNRAQAWRPSWSVLLKPLRSLSVYGSMSDGSQDQSTRFTEDGEQLGPQTWENAEVGVKYGHWDWLLSASAYHLKQKNVAVAIPDSRGLCGPTPTSSCYFRGGDHIKSEGYDFEMSGRLFSQLDLQLSYTTNQTKRVTTNLPAETRNPEKLIKLFAHWNVPWVPGLSIDTGASYRSRVFQTGTRRIYDSVTLRLISESPYEFDEPASTIWDLGADYVLNDNLSFNVYVENITDKEYYSTVGNTASRVGNPRTALFKFRWQNDRTGAGYTPRSTAGGVPFGNASDWYGALDLGQQISEDWEAESANNGVAGKPIRWTFETTPSPAFVARLGYRFNTQWRTEMNLGFRQNGFGKVGGSDTVPYGLCSVGHLSAHLGTPEDRLTNCYDPQGEAVYWSFLANVIRDFGAPENRLRPFVGVGLGVTRASVDYSGRLDGYTDTLYREWYQRTYGAPIALANGEKLLGADASWGPAFQLVAGLNWRFTDRASIDAIYKYTRDSLDINTVNLQDYYPRDTASAPLEGAGLPPVGSFKGDLASHVFTLGLRWGF